VADVYLETGDTELREALEKQWLDLVTHKLYVTGGAGSRHDGESFGQPYELPNEAAYSETCAAIASIMWNWRMLLATGQARFADVIERTLYNGFLSGVSLDGERFYYVNPLLSRGEQGVDSRQSWYRCACCPPNVMRLLQIHQYGSAAIEARLAPGRTVGVRVETDYPWEDRIGLTVTQTDNLPWELRLRLPGWCTTPAVHVDERALDVSGGTPDYLAIERVWRTGERIEVHLPMPPRMLEANPRLEVAHDCVAIERGPLIYCVEQCDHPTADLMAVQIDTTVPLEASWQPELLGGVSVVRGHGFVGRVKSWDDNELYRPFGEGGRSAPKSVSLTAVPYYAWANRQPGSMRVWIPRTSIESGARRLP
jgi:DUF1680 family protein